MTKVLDELRMACERFKCPLVIAGDLFDQPKPPPALLAFAWKHLPDHQEYGVYAVAGQHDLPNHSMEEFDESGLGLLVTAGRVKLLGASPVRLKRVGLYGASWGEEFPVPQDDRLVNVAVIHKYCWVAGHNFPGCPEELHVDQQKDRLKWLGYRSAVWGDNHRGFLVREYNKNNLPIHFWLNNGVVIPRNADFSAYTPKYALLYPDGEIRLKAFTAKPRWQPWVDQEVVAAESHRLIAFARDVAALVGKNTREDFLEEVEAKIARVADEAVRQEVWGIITRAKGRLV